MDNLLRKDATVDELFKTLVEKVLVKDAKNVVFVFEDGLDFEAVLEKVKN